MEAEPSPELRREHAIHSICSRRFVHRHLVEQEDEGTRVQKKIWDEVSKKLETLQPGVLESLVTHGSIDL